MTNAPSAHVKLQVGPNAQGRSEHKPFGTSGIFSRDRVTAGEGLTIPLAGRQHDIVQGAFGLSLARRCGRR